MVASADRGPWFNSPRQRPRSKPKRVRRPPSLEWQAPRRVSRLQGPSKPAAWVLKNRFEGLPDEEVYDDWERDRDFPRLPTRAQDQAYTRLPVCEQDGDVPYLPRQRRRHPHKPKAQVHSQLHAHEVSPQATNRSVNAQPYGSSYFLLGKLAGKAVTFLLDTGCTTNLLSWRLFDTLSARDRASLEPYDGEHVTLADGSCIAFHEAVELTGRVLGQVISETFIVSQLKEDAILGMPFLQRHKCHIDISKSAVVMAGRELVCVDRFG